MGLMILIFGISVVVVAVLNATERGWESLMEKIDELDKTRMTVLGERVRFVEIGRAKRKKGKNPNSRRTKGKKTQKAPKLIGPIRPELKTVIAIQLMQSGMDPSKEASWHAAAEDVVDLQMGDLGYELESQSEEIRMEDDESAYQASLDAQASEEAEAGRFEIERRDETIRMD